MARRVAIVPHTHWDREWYSPFQAFRLRLVEVLDDLLPRLEADPVVCPLPARRADGRGRRLPRGPARGRGSPPSPRVATDGSRWVPGTSSWTSSSSPARRSSATSSSASSAPPQFGGAMPVGYLPDMFGHIAQMPQLLQQFGFDDAVVWRGVPVAVDRTAFWWSSPDGSTVRAEYLPNGYGNGAVLPDDGKALLERISSWIESNQEIVRDAPVLIMNGSDHLAPQTFLGNVVSEANSVQDDLVARGHVARGLPRDGTARRSSPLAGRAAFRCAREPAHGSRVEPRRRASRRRRDRTQPRTARRAAVGAVPPGRGVARRAARSRLARGHPQCRARLDLRMLGRRSVRGRPAPLCRGPPDR